MHSGSILAGKRETLLSVKLFGHAQVTGFIKIGVFELVADVNNNC